MHCLGIVRHVQSEGVVKVVVYHYTTRFRVTCATGKTLAIRMSTAVETGMIVYNFHKRDVEEREHGGCMYITAEVAKVGVNSIESVDNVW